MRVSKAMLEEFKDNHCWLDMIDFLKLRLSGIRDELEIGETKLDVFSAYRKDCHDRGRSEEIRFLLELPDRLIENWESITGEKKEKGEDYGGTE
jgi:hypothetical protein